MQIQNNYNVNFKANKILTANIGKKKILNVYKLTSSKEDIHCAQQVYNICTKNDHSTPYTQKIKTFFASFLANMKLSDKNHKIKAPSYYIGQDNNKNLRFAFRLNNNMDNFVLFENYIKPNDQISTITLVRSVADEVIKQSPKSLISNSLMLDKKTLLKQEDLNKFVKTTNNPEATLQFELKNEFIDLYEILFNRSK